MSEIHKMWMPQREHVYHIVGTDRYVRFKKIIHKWHQGTEDESESLVQFEIYTLTTRGRLIMTADKSWESGEDVFTRFNGMELVFFGNWADVKPASSKTLDDKLRQCGDNLAAMFELLSKKTNRKRVNVYYGPDNTRLVPDGDTSPHGFYVHNDKEQGLYLSNQQIHHSTNHYRGEPQTISLSVLDYSQINRLVVHTTEKRKYTWERQNEN